VGGAVGQTDLRAAGEVEGAKSRARARDAEFFMLRFQAYLTRSRSPTAPQARRECSTPWCGSPGPAAAVDQTASMGCSIKWRTG